MRKLDEIWVVGVNNKGSVVENDTIGTFEALYKSTMKLASCDVCGPILSTTFK